MSTVRKRPNGTYQVTIRRNILPKPHYATFDTEAEATRYAQRMETLLNRGVVPDALRAEPKREVVIGDWVDRYLSQVHVSAHDRDVLTRLDLQSLRGVEVHLLDVHRVMQWVTAMKTAGLAPGTIRKKVGAMARVFDWCVIAELADLNPFRLIPKRYSIYTPSDGEAVRDVERDRRLHPGEEDALRAAMAGMLSVDRDAWVLLFTLAIETAMRLREMYTLRWEQVDVDRRTIFLDKTKNGDKRQVPLSSVALACLGGIPARSGLLFPWWDGNDRSLKKTTARLSSKWSRIARDAGCEDLNFHDLRHEATCRLYERTRLTDVQIARITGHKTLIMLKRYASLRGSDLAGELW
jgi:integrase